MALKKCQATSEHHSIKVKRSIMVGLGTNNNLFLRIQYYIINFVPIVSLYKINFTKNPFHNFPFNKYIDIL
jgi:hypothetical protein